MLNVLRKNYFYFALLVFGFYSMTFVAQEIKPSKSQETIIEGLSIYPNPVSTGKIYISSKIGADKDISIYDVLGKRIYQTILTAKELNIASILPGVYIIKVREGEATATRKLIVK